METRYMNDKSNVTSINYFKSFPGSAFKRFVWIESLKVTPPSPSILNEPAAISTASRSTWKSVFPWVSETRNDFVCTSSLSWPRNNWFSTRPSGSLVLNVMFLDDSANWILKIFCLLAIYQNFVPNVIAWPCLERKWEVRSSSRIMAWPSNWTPPSMTFSWPIPSWIYWRLKNERWKI